MRKGVTIFAVALGLNGALAAPSAHALGYSFVDIDVPGSQAGSTGFFGLSLNNLGQVVGSYEDSAGNENGFLYSGGKYIALNAPGASGTFLDGINDFGQVVGTAFYSNGSGFNFIDTRGKFTVISNAISPLGSNAINDRDQVLGNLGFPNYGVLNSQGIISPIDTSGANGTALVEGFNNLDQLAGELCDSVTCHGFTETNGVFTKIDPPNASFAFAQGVNDLGQGVGAYLDNAGNGFYTFIDTKGDFTILQDPNASAVMGGTEPYAINDLDQIVGSYNDAAGNPHVFFATPNLFPFAFTAATRLADPVPEPSTWVLMLTGLAGLGSLVKKRKRDLMRRDEA